MPSHPQGHQPGGPSFSDPLFDLVTGYRKPPAEGEGDLNTQAPTPMEVLNGAAIPEYKRREERAPGLAGTFAKGVASGALHPVRAIVGRPEEEAPPNGWTLGHTIADFAGEMGGIGLSFIPFLKGTQLALKGIGFGARTVGFRVAEGAISGAAFEAGSDTMENLHERVALGAGFGIAAEAVLLGASRAWRGHWGTSGRGMNRTPETRPERLLPSGPTTRTPGMEYSVNPNAITLERNLHPEGAQTFDEAVARFKLIETHGEQLHDAAARIAQQFRPFGAAILTGIENPGQTIRALRKQMPWEDITMVLRPTESRPKGVTRVAGQAWDESANGKPMYEILLMDNKVRTDLELLGIGKETIEGVFMGSGPLPSYKEVLKILKSDVPGELVPQLTYKDVTMKRAEKMYPGGFRGLARKGAKEVFVLEANDPMWRGAKERVSTLVHEYMHHFSWWKQNKETGKWDVNVMEVLYGKGGPVGVPGEELARVNKQMKELTLEVIQWDGHSPTEAEHMYNTYKSRGGGNIFYFQDDDELLSRAVEVMLVKPDLAKRIAPDVVRRLGDVIQAESPKLKAVLTKSELKRVHAILNGLWKKSDEGTTSIFQRSQSQFGREQAAQFEKFGMFKGMSIRHDGKEWVIDGITTSGKVVSVIDPMTGMTKRLDNGEFHRPLMAQVAARNAEVVQNVRKLIKGPAKWLGVILREAPINNPDGTLVGAVRRAVVMLDDYDRAPTLAKWLDDNREVHEKVLAEMRDQGLSPNDMNPEMVIMEMLQSKGQKGIVFNDGGRHLLFVGDDASLKRSSDVISDQWARSVDGEGMMGGAESSWAGPWIQPSQDNVMESLLRQAGVSERELEYFRNINPFEAEAKQVAEEYGLLERILTGAREVNTAAVPEPIETAAARSSLKLDRTTDGEYRLLTQTNEEVMRTADEATARAYINQMGPDEMMPDLEAASVIKSDALPHAAGGSVSPPKPFQQMPPPKDNRSSRFLDATQLFLSAFTAMENIAKSAERRGFGPIFTKVFHPIQEALERVDNQLAGIKRDALGGRTFSEQLKLIEQLSEGKFFGRQNRERQEMYVRAIEAMSKEEIAQAGGLLVRGLSKAEIDLANTFSSLGLQDDLPRLTGTLRMAKTAIEERGLFPRKLAEMSRVEVSPEFRQVLEQMKGMLDEMPDSVEGILRELGLSEREMTAVGMIDEILKKGVDDQSLFAISRYAAAKPLGKGYKSARDEYMALNGFNGKERKLVEELERTYKAAFDVSNLNYKKEVGGYWPHMRKWIETGFGPEEEFIRKHIPESVEWSAERVRTGELDVYLTDPVLTTAKYIRSMLMKQEFDPILPDVKAALANLEGRDERLHRIFAEYVHEAMGRPHASFRRLHEIISQSTHILTGKRPDPRFTRDVVNSLGSLANAAAIPFRPMLILRNYFQMTQMIPGRTGTTEFVDGLRMAMSDEGFKEAVEKGIVTKNVLPVHATSEIYGYDTSRFNRRMQRIFQKGFEWYQKPDDIGRAAAFFSAKARINRHVDDVMSDKISYETFKQRAKINTYDSVDIEQFDGLWRSGRYEEAKDYIGSRLARETIFRYGHANHPSGWGSVAGRLYGTFGTWPTQYKDYLLQGMMRGSTKDRFEFLAIHSAVNAATLAGGAAVGVDLMSWIAFPSLNYTGGPFADLTINTIQSFGGSPTEKRLANRNIRMMFPSLEDPRSIFIPGSYFIGDLYKAGMATDTEEAVIGGLGIRMLHKDSKNPFQGIWD